MLDISFVFGLALGMIVTGFCAIGSYNRGFDSVRHRSWSREHAARQKVAVTARGTRAAGPADRAFRKAS